MQINKSELHVNLDRGDGVCKYFDYDAKLCTIYDNRPIKCNVDKLYDLYFKKKMSREEYYKLNHEECMKLRRNRD